MLEGRILNARPLLWIALSTFLEDSMLQIESFDTVLYELYLLCRKRNRWRSMREFEEYTGLGESSLSKILARKQKALGHPTIDAMLEAIYANGSGGISAEEKMQFGIRLHTAALPRDR